MEIPELHSQLLKFAARWSFTGAPAGWHVFLPLLRVKQCEDVFARHEALLNVSHFQVVQRKHILLLFFLGLNRLKQQYVRSLKEVWSQQALFSRQCLQVYLLLQGNIQNWNICRSSTDVPVKETSIPVLIFTDPFKTFPEEKNSNTKASMFAILCSSAF